MVPLNALKTMLFNLLLASIEDSCLTVYAAAYDLHGCGLVKSEQFFDLFFFANRAKVNADPNSFK